MALKTVTFDPAEWQVVPKRMTEQMRDRLHGDIRILCDPIARTADIQNDMEVWESVLAAAPEPPAQQPPEPAAYMYQHDETGRTTFREPHERMNERRWQEFPLYRHLPSEEPTHPHADQVAGLIAACDPDTIAALLKERDRLRAALDRLYRWAKATNPRVEFGGNHPVALARAALADGEEPIGDDHE